MNLLAAGGYAGEMARRSAALPASMQGFALLAWGDDPDIGVRLVSAAPGMTRLRARGARPLATPGYLVELTNTTSPALGVQNGRRCPVFSAGRGLRITLTSFFNEMHTAGTNCTLSMYVRIDTVPSDGRIARTTGGSGSGFYLATTATGGITGIIYNGTTQVAGPTLLPVPQGLHLVTLRKTGLSFDLRVDAVTVTQAASSLAASGNAASTASFGATDTALAPLQGAILSIFYHPTAAIPNADLDVWRALNDSIWSAPLPDLVPILTYESAGQGASAWSPSLDVHSMGSLALHGAPPGVVTANWGGSGKPVVNYGAARVQKPTPGYNRKARTWVFVGEMPLAPAPSTGLATSGSAGSKIYPMFYKPDAGGTLGTDLRGGGSNVALVTGIDFCLGQPFVFAISATDPNGLGEIEYSGCLLSGGVTVQNTIPVLGPAPFNLIDGLCLGGWYDTGGSLQAKMGAVGIYQEPVALAPAGAAQLLSVARAWANLFPPIVF